MSDGPHRPGERTACVIVVYGEGLGKRITVGAAPVLVGRTEEADLHIPHRSVSRRHCEIHREPDGYFVRDLGATNATRLNDEPLATGPALLCDGDHITVGETILKFISQSSVEALYHEEVYQLATHDSLTNLCNRRHFHEMLKQEIARALRHHRPLTLCIIDVDLFKPVNDRFGHIEGDHVLRALADLMRRHVRLEDVAARIGGEEFSILFPETDLDAAHNFAERLREAVASTPFMLAGIAQTITISIGIASLGGDCDNPSALLRAADAALYRAKENGRNQSCIAA